MMTKDIPIHLLKEDSALDVHVKHIFPEAAEWSRLGNFRLHRDDCYSFVLLVEGEGDMELDFERVELKGSRLGIMKPWQVHANIRGNRCEAWMLRVAPDMMADEYRNFIDSMLCVHEGIPLTTEQQELMEETLRLLARLLELRPERPMYKPLIFHMLSVVLNIISVALLAPDGQREGKVLSRQTELCTQFKLLLSQYALCNKRPSFYAGKLCVSEVYLNEAVKNVTGLSVSAWIRRQVVLEAKRLLCFSKMNVKEIAHALGYEDHTYFSRMFRKTTGLTALEFRCSYLK